MNNFPNEILEQIFSYLDFDTRVNVFKVSKQWSAVVATDEFLNQYYTLDLSHALLGDRKNLDLLLKARAKLTIIRNEGYLSKPLKFLDVAKVKTKPVWTLHMGPGLFHNVNCKELLDHLQPTVKMIYMRVFVGDWRLSRILTASGCYCFEGGCPFFTIESVKNYFSKAKVVIETVPILTETYRTTPAGPKTYILDDKMNFIPVTKLKLMNEEV